MQASFPSQLSLLCRFPRDPEARPCEPATGWRSRRSRGGKTAASAHEKGTLPDRPRIVVVGAGFVGLTVARRLQRLLGDGEAETTIVGPENFMLYQPFLPEVVSGTLDPRHVVAPLRQSLGRTTVVTGRLVGLDREKRVAHVQPRASTSLELPYDHLVIGLGSQTRVFPAPGLAEHAVGVQSLAEAIHLRNHLFDRMEAAVATADERLRRRALTFVFVGGGYTGVEVLGEMEDLARSALRWYPGLRPDHLRWVLVEARNRILADVDPDLARFALDTLRGRGVTVSP